MPRISIVLPSYNRAALLAESIHSVIAQTYSDWELIVVDDGSTDATAEVVASFGPRVRYLRQQNAGPCAARNNGLAASTGELLLFLDSDDCLLPHALESLLALIEARPDIDVAYGWYYWTKDDGCPRRIEMPAITGSVPPQRDAPWGALTPRPSGPTMEGDVLHPLIQVETMLLGTALIRRPAVVAIGGFDPAVRFQEHWDLYLRLAAAGSHFACVRQAVAALRFHAGNRSKDYEAMLSSRLAIVERLCDNPTLADRLRDVRGRALANAYLEYAPLYYRQDDAERGLRCLRGAMEAVELTHADRMRVAAGMIEGALGSGRDPARVAAGYLAALPDRGQAQALRGPVLPEVHRMQALRLYRAGLAGAASRQAFRALIADPALRRNRTLARIGLEGLLGPRLFDLARRLPDSSLLRHAAATTSVFISPHFDDAALSCGGTLAHLAQAGSPIVLLTVFTALPAAGAQVSPLARRNHARQGDDQIYLTRRAEEERVARYLGARTAWLEFPDAIYRDLSLRYTDELFLPTYVPHDDPCYGPVRDALRATIVAHPGAMLFAPLGLGHHRDHLLVHAAVCELMRGGLPVAGCYFYEDYPYVASANVRARLGDLGRSTRAYTVDIRNTLSARVELIRMYGSQLAGLFHDPAQIEEEVLSYAAGIGTRYRPRERYWSGA